MGLFSFLKKSNKEKEPKEISYRSFQHFYEESFNGKDNNFSAVTRYIGKGYKLTEGDLRDIVLSGIVFLPTYILEKEIFDISFDLEKKLLKMFIQNKKYADVLLALLSTEKKETFAKEDYKTAAEIGVKYILSKKQMMIKEELYKILLPYCTADEKFWLAARVSDDCLIALIKKNVLEFLYNVEALTKIELSGKVLFFLHQEQNGIFQKYCQNGGKIGNNTERIFISAKALPDEYYEQNWAFPENVNFLKEIHSIEKIEELFSKRFPDTAEELFLFVDFICANNFSETFWKNFVEKSLSYENNEIIVHKLYQNPKGLPKLIEAGYPIDQII